MSDHQSGWGAPPNENVDHSPAASPLNMARAWQSVSHWWPIALPVGMLLAAILVATVWLTFEPTYEAEALLRIESNNAYIFFSEGATRVAGDRFERTQVQLIRSTVVLGRVIERPEIAALPEVVAMDSPARMLSKELAVGSQDQSDLFYVRLESPNPKGAALIVNAVVKQYVQLQDNEASTRNRRIIQLVEAEVGKRAEELEQIRSEVQSLERDLRTVVPRMTLDDDRNAPVPRSSADEWLTQLTTSIAEREVLEARVTAYEESMESQEVTVPADMIDQAVDESLEVQEERRLLAIDRLKLVEAKSNAAHPENSSSIRYLERQIQDHKSRMEELRSQVRPDVAARLKLQMARTEQSRLAAELAQMKQNIKVHETFESLLSKKIDEQRTPQSPPGDQAPIDDQLAKLGFARSDLVRAEQVYQSLLERADMLKTESRLPSRVSVLQPAEEPSAPKELLPLRKMGLAVGGGFLFPFLLAFLWEFRIQRVIKGRQISHDVALPLLAEVPRLPSRTMLVRAKSSKRFDSQRVTLQDSVHYLCRNLLLSGKACDLQVLAVTSAVSGEGKTTLASQLAVSLALYSRERVLLMDADLRHAGIHELFDVPVSPGLVELLAANGAGNATVETAVTKDRFDLVSVLPAGKLEKHPHVVLSAGRFETLLDTLRKSYRYVVVDTPPVVAAGEALSLCRAADGTLLAAMQDWSRQSEVQLAYERLVAIGANPVGIVLNGVSRKYYGSRYSYYNGESYG